MHSHVRRTHTQHNVPILCVSSHVEKSVFFSFKYECVCVHCRVFIQQTHTQTIDKVVLPGCLLRAFNFKCACFIIICVHEYCALTGKLNHHLPLSKFCDSVLREKNCPFEYFSIHANTQVHILII